jgi:hypothetical protein
MAQGAVFLISKHKAPSSNSSTTKNVYSSYFPDPGVTSINNYTINYIMTIYVSIYIYIFTKG